MHMPQLRPPASVRVVDLLLSLEMHALVECGRPDCREAIARMRTVLRDGQELPPLQIDLATGGHLSDGHHRLTAYFEERGVFAPVPAVWVDNHDGNWLFAAPGQAEKERDCADALLRQGAARARLRAQAAG